MAVAALVAACGPSRTSAPASAPPPGPVAPPPGFAGAAPAAPAPAGARGPCGSVRLFVTPACQSTLDQVCCSLETECGNDAACARLAECIVGCKGRGDNCTNGCANGIPAASMMKWGRIADCSKSVRYPPGVRCSDST